MVGQLVVEVVPFLYLYCSPYPRINNYDIFIGRRHFDNLFCSLLSDHPWVFINIWRYLFPLYISSALYFLLPFKSGNIIFFNCINGNYRLVIGPNPDNTIPIQNYCSVFSDRVIKLWIKIWVLTSSKAGHFRTFHIIKKKSHVRGHSNSVTENSNERGRSQIIFSKWWTFRTPLRRFPRPPIGYWLP